MMSVRFFIVPLGAVCMLIALGLQDAPARANRDGTMASVRPQASGCSQQRPAGLCIFSGEGYIHPR